jgi:Putative bacterial sensory transduction regulator
VSRAPLTDEAQARALHELIASWATTWDPATLLGVEHAASADDKGHYHWLIRLRGEEKDVVTVWLSLRQRSVVVETQVTPAPEIDPQGVYQYCLTKNAQMRELHFALGPEAGIYLLCHVPAGELDQARLDELVGASLHYADESFVTLMTLGFGDLYRRRRK